MWQIRGKIVELLCAVLCSTVVHTDVHTVNCWFRFTVRFIWDERHLFWLLSAYSSSMVMICVSFSNVKQNINLKHWNSAYLCQGTSYKRRDMDPDVCNTDPDPWSGSPPKFNDSFIGLLPTFPKISCKSIPKFLCKVAIRQTVTKTYPLWRVKTL